MLSFKSDLTNHAYLLDERRRVKLFIHVNTRICTLKSRTGKLVFFFMRILSFFFLPLPNLDSAPSCQTRIPEAIKLGAGQSCCADVMSVPNKPIWRQQNDAKNGKINK